MTPRFEHKFRIPLSVKPYLLALWEPYLVRAPFTDEAGTYPVLSQYFDSPRLGMYRDKVEGVGRRRKVRLRTYAWRFDRATPCFLEIKHREQETLTKTRAFLPAFRNAMLDPGAWANLPGAGIGPFASMASSLQLRPSARVLYLREAYQGAIDPRLRVTFDSALVAIHPEERPAPMLGPDMPRCLVPETEGILEIKTDGELGGWAERGIRYAELRQITYSKYALAVEALGLDRTETGVYL